MTDVALEIINAARSQAPRFWSKVDVRDESDCWEWKASIGSTGYGQFMFSGKPWKSHRFSWLISFGEIPAGHFVCHKCDNPKCVNPSHLFTGTQQDNENDKCKKERQPKGDDHWSKRMPERVARGCRHKSQTNPSFILRGEKVGGAKLTEEKVRAIRIQASFGVHQKKIADEFSVSRALVGLIVSRKRWNHVA